MKELLAKIIRGKGTAEEKAEQIMNRRRSLDFHHGGTQRRAGIMSLTEDKPR
jgi:hypothetical protein